MPILSPSKTIDNFNKGSLDASLASDTVSELLKMAQEKITELSEENAKLREEVNALKERQSKMIERPKSPPPPYQPLCLSSLSPPQLSNSSSPLVIHTPIMRNKSFHNFSLDAVEDPNQSAHQKKDGCKKR